VGYYSVTDILRDCTARLDRPESGTIRKALVRSSTVVFFYSSLNILLEFKVDKHKNLSYPLILRRRLVCAQTGLQKCGNYKFQVYGMVWGRLKKCWEDGLYNTMEDLFIKSQLISQ
jgi:hypothetical protein